MGSLRLATLLVLCVFGISCIPFIKGDGPTNVAPKGSVTDSATGKPIEGASVWFVACWRDGEKYSDTPRLLGSTNEDGNMIGSVSFHKWRHWTTVGGVSSTQSRFRIRISKAGYESAEYTNFLWTVPVNLGTCYVDVGSIALTAVASIPDN